MNKFQLKENGRITWEAELDTNFDASDIGHIINEIDQTIGGIMEEKEEEE